MFKSVNVIGRGRVGTAIASRLEERGVALREEAELALLCVPDSAIADSTTPVQAPSWKTRSLLNQWKRLGE